MRVSLASWYLPHPPTDPPDLHPFSVPTHNTNVQLSTTFSTHLFSLNTILHLDSLRLPGEPEAGSPAGDRSTHPTPSLSPAPSSNLEKALRWAGEGWRPGVRNIDLTGSSLLHGRTYLLLESSGENLSVLAQTFTLRGGRTPNSTLTAGLVYSWKPDTWWETLDVRYRCLEWCGYRKHCYF